MDSKIDRLRAVLSKIKTGYNNESSFDGLYETLKSEYRTEGGDEGGGIYWNNLRQSIAKQAEDYISKKKRRPVKGAPDEYESFVRNFKHDVTDEINRLKPHGST